jgi:Domain of unknown function (DUF4276)
MFMIYSVVEGHGEVKTVPLLLRRIAQEHQIYNFLAPEAMRVPKGRIKDDLGRILNLANIEFQARNVNGAVLIVLDADDDCPAELGIFLRGKAQEAQADIPVVIAVANKEFEAWYLAGIQSLQGKYGLPDTIIAPTSPENIRDAKGWLNKYMGSYSPTIHQEKFAAVLDLQIARQSQSFARFYDRVSQLLQTLKA